MLIVITGLDGSGTTSVAQRLHELDKNSVLVRTPSEEYGCRDLIDSTVRLTSQMAHYYFYLSSVKYLSDHIKANIDYKNNNVYCVRYLVDTIVSHQANGLDVKLDYEELDILKPDLTIFIGVDEDIRQERITKRGKSVLDKELDNADVRKAFLIKFNEVLDHSNTIYFDNSSSNFDENVKNLYNQIIEVGK